MSLYARIQDGVVFEFFETDGDITTMFHSDFIFVAVDGVPGIAEGWTATQVGDTWSFAEPIVAPLTVAELTVAAQVQRDALLAAANDSTMGMADAYISGLLNDADTTLFKAYAAYKLALNKIALQSGYPQSIAWPVSPS